VGHEDGVAHVQERRVGRGQLHGPGDQRLGQRYAERLAEVPQRLGPDLTVGVHLRRADDLAEVAVRVPARTRTRRTRALGRRAADRAVRRLGTDQVLAGAHVLADAYVAVGVRVVVLQAQVDQEVEGVPVAPRLAHRTGLDVAQRGHAGRVDDQPVGQA